MLHCFSAAKETKHKRLRRCLISLEPVAAVCVGRDRNDDDDDDGNGYAGAEEDTDATNIVRSSLAHSPV